MSKSRMINTKFWDDDYISNLDPIEKLLFLYFLTNTSTNISGIYEIPLKKIANETGVDKEMVVKVLKRFTRDKKVFYFNGWACLKNFVKNQNQNSPKVILGIKYELMAIPKDILKKFIGYGYSMDTLSHITKLNLTKLNTPDLQSGGVKINKKSMKKNSFNYNESASSDSYEEIVDLDSGEKITEKKASVLPTMKELVAWAVNRRGRPFVNIPKQYLAMKKMRAVKINPEDIKNRWIELEGEDLYKKIGFDFMTIASSFDRKPL